MNRKSLLYIMGIDWEWIYQRPQIIAEKLAQDYQVTVLFPRNILLGNKKLPVVSGMDFRILWTLPFQEKNTLIGKAAEIMNSEIFKDLDSFDYIYVGYPLYARYIPEDYPGKLIYDCMDNHEMLYPDRKRVAKIVGQEKELIKRCDLLVSSAVRLQNKVDTIAGYSKSILIRNGAKNNEIYEVKQPIVKEHYSLAYIGTIAEWFDYELMTESLDSIKKIDYQLIGPAKNRVEQPGIVYHGPIVNEDLGESIKDYDCLIMPFQVNDIVAFVDPVKLYEYIAFGKCIVSVYYPEIERFKDYIYFYETPQEYIKIIQRLVEEGFPPKYNRNQQVKFLQDNTWDERYRELKKRMMEMA